MLVMSVARKAFWVLHHTVAQVGDATGPDHDMVFVASVMPQKVAASGEPAKQKLGLVLGEGYQPFQLT